MAFEHSVRRCDQQPRQRDSRAGGSRQRGITKAAEQSMTSDTRFHPGDLLDGRLEVIRAIRGGVGEVYLCMDRSTNRPIALKRLQNRYAKMPKFAGAFRREAETWIQLGQHPNIVPCIVLQ